MIRDWDLGCSMLVSISLCIANIYSNIDFWEEVLTSHIYYQKLNNKDVTPPVIMGTAVQYDGFADMTDYIT